MECRRTLTITLLSAAAGGSWAKRRRTEQRRVGAHFPTRTKKNDVAERSGAFRHVGLLTNAPSGSRRLALYLVVRGFRENFQFRTSLDPMILPLAAANTSTVWSITANRHLFNASCPARGTKTLDWHKERHLTVAPETDFAVLRDTLPKSRSLCCSRLSARNPAHRCYWRRFRASGSARSCAQESRPEECEPSPAKVLLSNDR